MSLRVSVSDCLPIWLLLYTLCTHGSTLDHVLVSGPVRVRIASLLTAVPPCPPSSHLDTVGSRGGDEDDARDDRDGDGGDRHYNSDEGTDSAQQQLKILTLCPDPLSCSSPSSSQSRTLHSTSFQYRDMPAEGEGPPFPNPHWPSDHLLLLTHVLL